MYTNNFKNQFKIKKSKFLDMATNNAEIYRPIDDQIYNISKQPAAIDKDTVFRYATYQCANSGSGTATAASPLNSGTNQTTFDITNNAGSTIRYGTLGLRLRGIFTLLGNSAATVPLTTAESAGVNNLVGGLPYNAPSWNMLFKTINQMTIFVNGAPVYNSIPGLFCEDMTAKLLRYYSNEAINNHPAVFGPMNDVSYTGYSAKAAAAVVPADGVVSSVMPNQLPSMAAAYNAFTWGADAAHTFIGFNPDINPLAHDPCLMERAKKYCGIANSHLREITKIIPLRDILNFPDCLISNLRNLKIQVGWAASADIVDHFSTNAAAGAATQAQFCLTNCDLVSDSYMPTVSQATTSVSEKLSGQIDILPYYNTRIFPETYTPNADIRINNISNLDAVMIFQPARAFSNGNGTAANVSGYASWGQFLTFGDSVITGANALRLTTDALRAVASDSSPISEVQIEFGGRAYPSIPITCSKALSAATIAFDPSQLYMEYLKGVGKFGRRDAVPAVSYEMFKGCMPFIYLRPFADDAPKMSNESRDLIIRMKSGVSSTIIVVCFCHGVCTLAADGTAKIY